jgi:hypothetical protein
MDLLLRSGASSYEVSSPEDYSPSTFFTGGTAGPWYDFGNSASVLNASSNSATNGQTVGTVNDSGTAAINGLQTTETNRPTLRSTHVNNRAVVQCDSSDFLNVAGLNAFTNAATSITVCAVFRPIDGSTNHCALRQFDNSYSYDRFNALFVGLRPSIGYSRDGGNFSNLRTGSVDVSPGVYHAIIWVADFTNGQTAIYMDNATYLSLATAGGSTVAGAMNATNANESRVIRTSNGFWGELYVHKNALMTSVQRADWFTAVKSRFGLTAY